MDEVSEHMPMSTSDGLLWHAVDTDTVAAYLSTDPKRGLTGAEAAHRLVRDGRNELAAEAPEPWWKEALESVTEPMVLLLIAVGVLYAIFGRLEDAITIFVVIAAVAGIEMFNEAKAKRAVAALSGLVTVDATVMRNGGITTIPAAELVPGDLVLLDAGARVAADLRLVETRSLRVDESPLTGESQPVDKQIASPVTQEAALAERTNLAFAGTLVTGGQGRGLVVATGMATEVGRVVGLTRGARPPRTPLQLQLKGLATSLVWLALGFSAVIPALEILLDRLGWREALLEGLTLAFATIPEELPILITVVLGVGAYRLARRQAIVKHLHAAETLGSVSVIGADKTGTLTENRMDVVEVAVDGRVRPFIGPSSARPSDNAGGGDSTVTRILLVGALATDAEIRHDPDGTETFVGDPTDTALLEAARDAGLLSRVRALRVVAHVPFDDRRRISASYEATSAPGTRTMAVKGAVEDVLAQSVEVRRGGELLTLDAQQRYEIVRATEAMAARGLRVIAFAERSLDAGASGTANDETALTFLGMVGLEDPPREQVAEAIAALGAAGVRVVMITGDHPGTARAIAGRVGIESTRVVTGQELAAADAPTLALRARDASVFARVSPEQKLRLVEALEASGHVVAVMGDGVNDAPALRRASIGIAMGHRGTDAAREAADLVLRDDNFATVEVAVRSGRVLYENLRKAVRYYLAAKVGLIISSLGAVLAGVALPFAPVQIIVLELFMDVGASTTFVAEPPEGDVMRRSPRDPRAPFLDRSLILGILAGGASLAAAVLVGYLVAARGAAVVSSGSPRAARTAAFATWLIGHIVLAAHMRAEREPLLNRGLRLTLPFSAWAASAVILAVAGPYVPFVAQRLGLMPLDGRTWMVVVAAALVLPSWWEAWKWWRWRR